MFLDPLIERLESSKGLDSLGRTLANAFAAVVRPGVAKDLVSGPWLGHPVHPTLTDVPIGLWSSALVLDVLGGKEAQKGSEILVGLGALAAVPTAVTGLSDLADVVNKPERSVGTAHALGNTSALALYALSYVARRTGNHGLGKGLGMLGALTVTASGYLGGHLVYRKGIGPNQTAFDKVPSKWTPVLGDDELVEGKPQRVWLDGTGVFLLRQDGEIHALANRCSHRGGPLNKGSVGSGTVTCPWHLSTFRVEDGSIVQGPATAPQPSYEARVQEGRIEVRARP
jgi:nitrite reductase/ring-hydroxylating ferredoxin subunit/uncharacterized membrane protein